MSSRLLRLLLRLYPRRFRRRYGNELVDLHHELKTQAGVSPIRLLADMLAGVWLVRPAHRALQAIAAGLVIAGLAIAGPIIVGRSAHPQASYPQLRLAAKRIPGPLLPGYGCFVAADSPCSLHACTVYVAQPSKPAVAHRSAPTPQHQAPRAVPAAPSTTATCVSSPNTKAQPPVFVGVFAQPTLYEVHAADR